MSRTHQVPVLVMLLPAMLVLTSSRSVSCRQQLPQQS